MIMKYYSTIQFHTVQQSTLTISYLIWSLFASIRLSFHLNTRSFSRARLADYLHVPVGPSFSKYFYNRSVRYLLFFSQDGSSFPDVGGGRALVGLSAVQMMAVVFGMIAFVVIVVGLSVCLAKRCTSLDLASSSHVRHDSRILVIEEQEEQIESDVESVWKRSPPARYGHWEAEGHTLISANDRHLCCVVSHCAVLHCVALIELHRISLFCISLYRMYRIASYHISLYRIALYLSDLHYIALYSLYCIAFYYVTVSHLFVSQCVVSYFVVYCIVLRCHHCIILHSTILLYRICAVL